MNSQSAIQWFVYECAGFLRVEINNPSIAEDGVEYALRLPQNYNHDSATNFVLTTSAIICAGYLIFKLIRKNKCNHADLYMYASGISFLFFCFIVRWEPYVTRYMLAYFALICPGIVGVLYNIEKKEKKKFLILVSIICFMCMNDFIGLIIYHYDIYAKQKEYTNRNDGYFYYNTDVIKNYDSLMTFLNEKKAEKIGLYIAGTQYEYPIWEMTEYETRMEEVLVDNESIIYDDSTFIPDYIVSISMGDNQRLQYHGIQYTLVESFGNEIEVLKKNAD